MTSRSSWKAFERRVARAIGGLRVPTSGGMKASLIQLAGDAISDYVCVEAKFSGSRSKNGNRKIALSYDWFPKIVDETNRIGGNRIPAIVIHFKNGKDKDWAFIRHDDLLGLITLPIYNDRLFEQDDKKSRVIYEESLPPYFTFLDCRINGQGETKNYTTWACMTFKTFIELLTTNHKIGCEQTLKQYTFLKPAE